MKDAAELDAEIDKAMGKSPIAPEALSATRAQIIEECAQVLDRIVAGMAAHKNPEGMVTGRDFYHPEIDYIEKAAKDVRALKGSHIAPEERAKIK